jgi:aminopeptidase N
VKSGKEEPLSTHADHFNTNYAYSVAAYSKGSIFLSQLGYIVGEDNLDKILLEYYKEWKYKHPNANDFIRIAEKVSGLELQWYKEYWVYTTKTIDYALGNINVDGANARITLKRLGLMPMPADVLVTYKDGTREMHYVPLNLTFGAKPAEDTVKTIVHEEWKWVDPEYSFTISRPLTDIKSIEIDPSQRMADVNRINNKIVVP